MSLAAEAREAVRRHPFLLAGLRAGVVNYTAAARFLDVAGDEDAVATALRRYAEELPDRETRSVDARVTMESGLGLADAAAPDGATLAVGGAAVLPDAGDLTGVLAEGAVDATALAAVLDRLAAADVEVAAAGVAGEAMLVVVGRRDGAAALRVIEAVLDGVPTAGEG
ncbi:hypothetical protein BRC81_15830 [Halobacteriales archaeon QS_1_68_20]|nr:MAG: hypothetical protein BRC81_15830 [Halobacteriales archaeon QS_1_68_20]